MLTEIGFANEANDKVEVEGQTYWQEYAISDYAVNFCD